MIELRELLVEWPRAVAETPPVGIIKTTAEDFQVDEIPRVQPCGQGEHLWLHVKKCRHDTQKVARILAQLAAVPISAVGFAGMKDNHALTTQWFSIWLPGKDFSLIPQQLPTGISILEERRHNKKLKRGVLRGNQFTIIIRDITGDTAQLEKHLIKITSEGVPNYFSTQRFGKRASNLHTISRILSGSKKLRGRQQKSIVLSTMRSWLFNQIVAERINMDCWQKPLLGDVFMLNGSHSIFTDDGQLDQNNTRLAEGDIHITAPLYGRGSQLSEAAANKLESRVLQQTPELLVYLQEQGVDMSRRATRLVPGGLNYTWLDETSLKMEFSLPAGGYATSVLHELFDVKEFDLKFER